MEQRMALAAAPGSYPKICEDTRAVNFRRALHRFDEGKITSQELEEAYRATIARVVKEQEEAGLDVITDGQIRWEDLLNPFARKMAGVKIGGLTRFYDNNFYYRRPEMVGPVGLIGPATVEDFRYASSLTRKKVKAVVVGPASFADLSQNDFYKNREVLLEDLALALRQEIIWLIEAGADLIQIDEPSLCCNPDQGEAACQAIRKMIQGLNAQFILCLYFGSIQEVWEKVLALPVSRLAVDLVSRPENREIALATRLDKALALGAVDARNTRLEHEDGIIATLERAAAISPGPIHLSANCGLEFLPHDKALEKMMLISRCVEKFNLQCAPAPPLA